MAIGWTAYGSFSCQLSKDRHTEKSCGADTFLNWLKKKGGEGGEGGEGSKIIVTIHTGFATFTAFYPGRFDKMSVF